MVDARALRLRGTASNQQQKRRPKLNFSKCPPNPNVIRREQALLTFVQRYKGHVSSEQRDALMDLIKHQGHYKITQEIRRELVNAKCRDLEVDEPMAEPSM